MVVLQGSQDQHLPRKRFRQAVSHCWASGQATWGWAFYPRCLPGLLFGLLAVHLENGHTRWLFQMLEKAALCVIG